MNRGLGVTGLAGLAVLLAGCGLLLQDPDSGTTPAPAAGNNTPALSTATGAQAELDSAAPAPDTAPSTPPAGDRSGSLRQSEISMYLRRGDLQLRVTPLAERIIGTTAPDTHERLQALAGAHEAIFREGIGVGTESFQLFLVAVHSESVEVAFEPEDLNLVSRGLRYRPVAIRAVTPHWSRHRVAARETLMAVYAFPSEVDLESGGLEVEYREVRDRSWERILPRVQAERGRMGG